MLASYREPAPPRRLPADCISHEVLYYDRLQFDLVTAVARDLLGLRDSSHGWMSALESYWLSEEEKRHQPPGKVHSRVRACSSVCDAYEGLIRNVVGPHLLSRFNAGSNQACEPGSVPGEQQSEPETVLLYQFPPTLRIFCSARVSGSPPGGEASEGVEERDVAALDTADNGTTQGQPPAGDEDGQPVGQEAVGQEACPRFKSLGRLHNDAQYGHQTGEVNFWLPLTRLAAANTMWTESAEGRGDFKPVLLQELGYAADVPEADRCEPQQLPIQRFHGTLCRHHTQPNSSGRTRVSLDFRCAPKSAFDSEWKLPGIVHRHDMREMHFDASVLGL